MVSTLVKNKSVVVKINLDSSSKADKLARFLEEEAEIWLNRKALQKEFDELEKEENERFEFE